MGDFKNSITVNGAPVGVKYLKFGLRGTAVVTDVAGTGAMLEPVHGNESVREAYFYVEGAPTGAALTISLRKNGTAAAQEIASFTCAAGTNGPPPNKALNLPLADGDRICAVITAVGSTAAGRNPMLVLVRY